MRISFLILPALLWGSTLAAQSPTIAPAPSPLFAPAAATVTRGPVISSDIGASREGGRTGLALGAGLGTVAAFALWYTPTAQCAMLASASGGCGSEGPAPISFLLLPAAGAGLGYMIGSTVGENFRGPADEAKDRGLNWWQGGLLGSAIGSLAGIVVADLVDDGSSCPGCSPTSKGEYQAAGAGGAAVGFLIGARVASR